jgi:hypothetical protein
MQRAATTVVTCRRTPAAVKGYTRTNRALV